MLNPMEVRRRALTKLKALKPQLEKLGGMIQERYVTEFHVELDRLEALGDAVTEFRIPKSDVNPRGERTSYIGNERTYSTEKYVVSTIMLPRLDAAIAAIEVGTRTKPGEDTDVMDTIARICERFGRIERQLRRRHGNRNALEIKDEYDVQDLMHALLQLHFDDIRPEEWTPSSAGASCRMDFLLKQERVVIEAKMTKEGLRDKQIGEQFIIDREKYRAHQDCRTLVCFVYDPTQLIVNPVGLVNDLQKGSTEQFAIRVFVGQ